MKYTRFSEKHNTLYINTKQLLPNTSGLSWKEHCKANDEAFKMSLDERIEKYACEEAKQEIQSELEKHKGCKISEYANA